MVSASRGAHVYPRARLWVYTITQRVCHRYTIRGGLMLCSHVCITWLCVMLDSMDVLCLCDSEFVNVWVWLCGSRWAVKHLYFLMRVCAVSAVKCQAVDSWHWSPQIPNLRGELPLPSEVTLTFASHHYCTVSLTGTLDYITTSERFSWQCSRFNVYWALSRLLFSSNNSSFSFSPHGLVWS